MTTPTTLQRGDRIRRRRFDPEAFDDGIREQLARDLTYQRLGASRVCCVDLHLEILALPHVLDRAVARSSRRLARLRVASAVALRAMARQVATLRRGILRTWFTEPKLTLRR